MSINYGVLKYLDCSNVSLFSTLSNKRFLSSSQYMFLYLMPSSSLFYHISSSFHFNLESRVIPRLLSLFSSDYLIWIVRLTNLKTCLFIFNSYTSLRFSFAVVLLRSVVQSKLPSMIMINVGCHVVYWGCMVVSPFWLLSWQRQR